MKQYDFDTIIDRAGSYDIKHRALLHIWGRDDLLPMWIADMDFATPDFIIDAMRKRLDHPIFGYTAEPREFKDSIIDWVHSHHDWQLRREWIKFIPGIVKGIGFVVNVFVAPDEKVIIQPPVYHPFRIVPTNNDREVVYNPLILREDGYYDMDFDNLEQVYDDKCKVLILCNPHNPGGLCWSKETLTRLADFCFEHHLIVISDEIHSDLMLFGHLHIPFATVSERAAQISITFGAPSKTFNMAGIVSSYSIISNAEIRNKFYSWIAANELNEPTIFAPIATIAAFTQGEEWRKQLVHYLEDNVKFVEEYCKINIPQVRPLRPQASFLVWLNCRDLHLDHAALQDLFVNKAQLALNDGETFATGGNGFMRLNIGSPRKIIEQGLYQLANAVHKHMK